jgi:hypothetical protein
LHKYLYAYDSPTVYTDPWGEYALNSENEQFNPDVTNQYDVQRMRTLVEHATSERGQHPAFRGDYESIVTAANSPRTKDWNEEARLSLYRLYSELYDSSVPQNDFGFVYTENAPESLHQNGWTHIKDFATARVPLGTRVKTGAAASAAALVAIVAPEAIAVTGIYGQAALWTGLGFAAVKETAVASIEGPATRAREIRDEITRPWRENDPIGAALQFGGLAGFGLSFSPAVQSVTRPLMQRAAGAIEAKAASLFKGFGQMGEGSEVMAASDRMFQDVGLHRQAAQGLKALGLDANEIRITLAENYDPTKIAVVGRLVGKRVGPLANKEGWSYFKPSEAARTQYREQVERIFGKDVPEDIARQTLGMSQNIQQIENWIKDGYSFVDIGEPIGPPLKPSPYYNMEGAKLYGTGSK